jgi:hypothetical protein
MIAMFRCRLFSEASVGVAVVEAAAAETEASRLVDEDASEEDEAVDEDVIDALEEDALDVAEEDSLVAVLEAAEGERIELRS